MAFTLAGRKTLVLTIFRFCLGIAVVGIPVVDAGESHVLWVHFVVLENHAARFHLDELVDERLPVPQSHEDFLALSK